jgi:hypothetical protein
VRRWELRQLDHAAGAWYRLARRLALARRAWTIDDEDVAALVGWGYVPDPAGLDFEPPRQLFVVPEEVVGRLRSAREIVLQSSPELVACRNLALVSFDDPPTATAPARRR